MRRTQSGSRRERAGAVAEQSGNGGPKLKRPDHAGAVFGIDRSAGLGGLGGAEGGPPRGGHGFLLARLSCDVGAGGFEEETESDEPNRMTGWLKDLAPGAAAMVAIGTCATWGGVPAAAGNITGSMGLMDYLGKDYRSALGVPVVNLPGCSPVGDNITETVAAVLLFLQNLGPLPKFDELGRPAWLFVEIGCWGPVVQCNIVERGAMNHMGGCMVAGGACIGCTMPGFPDKYSPFYKAPPGSAISGGISKVYGGAIRRLRRQSMKTGNREPIWDSAEEIPSAWARAPGGRSPGERGWAYFYKKLQYRGSVNHYLRYKQQPLPQSRDILRQKGIDHYE